MCVCVCVCVRALCAWAVCAARIRPDDLGRHGRLSAVDDAVATQLVHGDRHVLLDELHRLSVTRATTSSSVSSDNTAVDPGFGWWDGGGG